MSEFLNTLGLVKSYFSSFLRKKNLKKSSFCGAPTPQRIRRFACLQDCLLTLTCHLASRSCLGPVITRRVSTLITRRDLTMSGCVRQKDSSEETEEESVLMQASIEQYDLFYSVY